MPAGGRVERGGRAHRPDPVGAAAAGGGHRVDAPAHADARPRRAVAEGLGVAQHADGAQRPVHHEDQLDAVRLEVGHLVGTRRLVLGDGLFEDDVEPEFLGLALEGVLGVGGGAGGLVDDADLLASTRQHVLDEARQDGRHAGPVAEDGEGVGQRLCHHLVFTTERPCIP